jgi:hypothetical protein
LLIFKKFKKTIFKHVKRNSSVLEQAKRFPATRDGVCKESYSNDEEGVQEYPRSAGVECL